MFNNTSNITEDPILSICLELLRLGNQNLSEDELIILETRYELFMKYSLRDYKKSCSYNLLF